jgi:2-desacetyl-2-hydroxyethyl bacteriochlorophyllide A dehydrogenase
MRGTVYLGPRQVRLSDLPDPQVKSARDAVIRVTRSAICGTDLHAYRGELPGFGIGTVLGHEFTGVVLEAGSEVPLRPGQRVTASDIIACGRCAACVRGWHYQCPGVTLFGYSTVVGRPVDGGQAEYVRVPCADVVLSACPDDLSDEQVLFTGDILPTGFVAAQRAQIVPGDTVAVVGGGPVGTIAALCAMVSGAGHAVVAEPHRARRQALADNGLQAVPPRDLATVIDAVSRGRGAPAVIEAVGSDEALSLAIAVAAPRATVVCVGAHHSTAAPFPSGSAFARELTVRFAVGDPILVRDQVTALVQAGRLDPTVLISHRLPLADVTYAYDLYDRREATKVVLVADET